MVSTSSIFCERFESISPSDTLKPKNTLPLRSLQQHIDTYYFPICKINNIVCDSSNHRLEFHLVLLIRALKVLKISRLVAKNANNKENCLLKNVTFADFIFHLMAEKSQAVI